MSPIAEMVRLASSQVPSRGVASRAEVQVGAVNRRFNVSDSKRGVGGRADFGRFASPMGRFWRESGLMG